MCAGTTIGAGILAVPFTTQDAGFVPSSAAILGTYVFSIVTGLLLAEANINLMCELGQVILLAIYGLLQGATCSDASCRSSRGSGEGFLALRAACLLHQ